MFPLHERTQRILCRIAFFPLCVLPTLVVAWWCMGINLPSRSEAFAQAMSRELGLDVSVGDVSYPLPGRIRLHQVTLRDPISKEQLGSCPTISLVGGEGRWSVQLEKVDVSHVGLAALWQTLQQDMRVRPGRSFERIFVDMRDIKIIGQSQTQTWARVECQVGPHPAGRELYLEIAPTLVDASDIIRVQCVPAEDNFGSGTHWTAHTGENELSVSLLKHLVPELAQLGDKCDVRGSLDWYATSDGGRATFDGTLTDLNLPAISASANLGDLNGEGQLVVQTAELEKGQLTALEADFRTGPGMMSPRVLRKLDQFLSRQDDSSFPANGEPIRYDQLAISVKLAADGWHFQGICDEAAAGAIVVSGDEVLLRQTAVQAMRPLRHTDLAELLADERSRWIPWSERTAWLLGHLPAGEPATERATTANRTGAPTTQRQ